MTDLKDCRYCGGKAKYYTHEDINRAGEPGYKSVCYCSRCGMQVEGFDTDPIVAERKAADWWNRGIYDAGGR